MRRGVGGIHLLVRGLLRLAVLLAAGVGHQGHGHPRRAALGGRQPLREAEDPPSGLGRAAAALSAGAAGRKGGNGPRLRRHGSPTPPDGSGNGDSGSGSESQEVGSASAAALPDNGRRPRSPSLSRCGGAAELQLPVVPARLPPPASQRAPPQGLTGNAVREQPAGTTAPGVHRETPRGGGKGADMAAGIGPEAFAAVREAVMGLGGAGRALWREADDLSAPHCRFNDPRLLLRGHKAPANGGGAACSTPAYGSQHAPRQPPARAHSAAPSGTAAPRMPRVAPGPACTARGLHGSPGPVGTHGGQGLSL